MGNINAYEIEFLFGMSLGALFKISPTQRVPIFNAKRVATIKFQKYINSKNLIYIISQ